MKSKKIIHSILSENAIDAKKLIQEDLTIKLGERLAEEYVRVAKMTFNEEDEYGPAAEQEEEEEESMESEEGEEEGEEEEEEMMEASDTELAAMYPPKDKITRGDIIAAAQKKSKKGKK
jgi:hypothetical protein